MEDKVVRDVISTRQKLEEINELSAQLEKHRGELMTFLRINCFDNCVNFESKEDYYPGTYNDTAYTLYYKSCSVCGKYQKIAHKNHSWR